MKKSTLERLNYALRPAKNMERKMFCEALARLSRIARLSSYRYVGFGAIGFHDFCLFHQRLGINDMISIEGFLDAKVRVEFNIPYSCIRMRWGMSHEILPTLKWSKRAVIWLDYERPLDKKMLDDDIALVAASARSGSVLIVTTPADPGKSETGVQEKRLHDLRARVTKDKMPGIVEGKDLAKWGMAKVCRQIVINQITKTLSDRNAAVEEDSKIHFSQLFNFNYADGIRMMTVGGLLVNGRDGKSLSPRHFKDLDFYKPADEPYLIETPLLTFREINYLDERLPRSVPHVRHPKWIPEIERKKYAKVYRYFPSFSEVEV